MDKDKIKLIAIIGKTGAGKHTIVNALKEKIDCNLIIRYSNKPLGKEERNGINYHFLTSDEFASKIINGEIIEASLDEWAWGTSIKSLNKDKINIGIFQPESIYAFLEYKDKIDLTVYQILTTEKERMIRLLNKEDKPDIDAIIENYQKEKKEYSNLEFSQKLDFNSNGVPPSCTADLILLDICG